MRVQIPAYTDRWMMGDRYGEVVKVATRRLTKKNREALDYEGGPMVQIAHVKLDISGKTLRFIADDCEVL